MNVTIIAVGLVYASVCGNVLMNSGAADNVIMGDERTSFGWYLRHVAPVVLLSAMAGLGFFLCVFG